MLFICRRRGWRCPKRLGPVPRCVRSEARKERRALMRDALARSLAGTALLAGALFSLPGPIHAQTPRPDLDHINLTYRGGPLLQHPKVVLLFWGAGWQSTSTTALVNTT